MSGPEETRVQLLQHIQQLEMRLEEAESTLQAIRHGEVDALVVSGPAGPQVYTLQSADHPYRILVQEMQEGALTLTSTGLILYANLAFARMMRPVVSMTTSASAACSRMARARASETRISSWRFCSVRSVTTKHTL